MAGGSVHPLFVIGSTGKLGRIVVAELLISSGPAGDRVIEHGNVIAAARSAAVGPLADTSLLHADTSPLGLREDHLRTEGTLSITKAP